MTTEAGVSKAQSDRLGELLDVIGVESGGGLIGIQDDC